MISRQKILVIDDDELVHRIVEARLKDLGVDLIHLYEGQAALESAQQASPDLVLLDVNMPGISGFDVIQQLKNEAATYNIPVIFLTGQDDSTEKVRGFDLGAVDYVTKPFDPSELRARVRGALNTKALMDLLTTQAQLDGLTGLHNRRFFDQRLEQELDAAWRYQRQIGLLLLDIDHFKMINDEYGHPKGDQVLRKLAAVIDSTCRASDVPCRFGGEEFAIIQPEGSPDAAYQFGLRLHKRIGQEQGFVELLGRSLTVSVGAACSESGKHTSSADLIAEADKALYAAKNAGRNRVVRASEVASAATPTLA